MPINIGEFIQKEVESQRLTYKEFGALIHRNEKTIQDIYDRASMSTDLLITISAALKKDFLKVFYSEDPMKSLRADELTKLNLHIQRIAEENNRLQKELDLTQTLVETQKEFISFVKDQLANLNSS